MSADEEGGDPACWLGRVCPECGLLAEEPPPTVCARCGAELPAPDDADPSGAA
jgi:hypothetical protein